MKKPKPKRQARRAPTKAIVKAKARPELPIVEDAWMYAEQLPAENPAMFLNALRLLLAWQLPGCMSEVAKHRSSLFWMAATFQHWGHDANLLLDLMHRIVEQKRATATA